MARVKYYPEFGCLMLAAMVETKIIIAAYERKDRKRLDGCFRIFLSVGGSELKSKPLPFSRLGSSMPYSMLFLG